MPGSTGPNLGLVWGYSPHEDGWGVGGYNPGFARLDTLVHLTVLGVLNNPPGSPVNGDRYIVDSAPTGDFVSHEDEIAVYLTTGTPGWSFYVPQLGWRAWNDNTDSYTRFNGSAWVTDTGSTNSLAGLTDDVDITSPADGDLLRYDSGFSKWVNSPASGIIHETKTANYSILISDSGKCFNNIGATGEVDLSLPTAAAGLRYSFIVDAAQTVKIIAQALQSIALESIISATGGSIEADTPYQALTIESHKAGFWVVTSATGSWTVT